MQIAKFFEKCWQWVRWFLVSRLDRLIENINLIGLSLMLLIFNWHLGWSSRFVFKFELLNQIASCYFYSIPFLLLANSVLFINKYQKISSILAALFSGCLIFLIFIVRFVMGNHIDLVERVECPNGKIFSVYENFEPSFITTDDVICQF